MLAVFVLAATCFLPPVDGAVVEPFDAPECTWCSGHRGITFAVATGTPVRAVAPGIVSFAGVVAGIRYVVVRIDDDRRVTYGQLRTAVVGEGDTVATGQVIATTTTVLHLGLRDGDEYIDPAP